MLSNIASLCQTSHYRVKDREKSLVFQEICNFAPCSRKEIAKKTRIRPTTVSRVVQEMLNDGLVFECGDEKALDRRGRPEIFLKANLNRLVAISLYLQSRQLYAALINLGEEILEEQFATLEAKVTNTRFIGMCAKLIRKISQKVPAGSELLGFAISLVGTVNSRDKIWISASRWRNIHNLEFSSLEKMLKLPVVLNRMQDAELEYLIQKTPRYRNKNVLFIHWGFGIGASYANRGKVLTSTIGRFAEIGHTRISLESNKECQCGARGCLETEAALWALREDPEMGFVSRFSNEKVLGQYFKEMDLLSTKTVKNALRYIEFSLLNLHQIFYPDVVIFYGPFTENREVFRSLSSYLKNELPSYARNTVEWRAVEGGFQSCIRSNLYEFFKKRLQELLRVSTTKI
jgi:transcriptional regulator of PTS gene